MTRLMMPWEMIMTREARTNHHPVASLGLVSPGVVIAAPKKIWDLFKMKNVAIFSLLHKKLNSSHKTSAASFFFSLLHKKYVIYNTKFPNYLFKPFYPQKLIFFPRGVTP